MSEAVSDLDVASDSSIEPSLNSADEEANVNESLVAESERSSGEDEKGEESSALPWKQIIPLCLVQLCETFSSSGVFTYAGFLVKDFTGKPIDQAGTLAGFLPSAAYFGMFLGGMPWGYLSDRFGKRVCLLLGTIGSTVCALGLGFSQNLLMAILFRFLSGLLNGNLGIVKSYLGAISNSKNQGRAFSLIAIVWGAGALIGSAIGGFAARPCIQYKDLCSDDSFFGRFPYLLPNLINAVLMLCSFVLGFFFLTEPNVKRVASKEAVSVWKQRPAMLAAFAYIFLGFGFIIFEETIPLFFASSRGLNFETAQIGIFQSMMGIVLLCTTSVYNFVPDRIGFIRTHRLGIILGVPLCLLTPFLHLLVGVHLVLSWLGLFVFAFAWCFVDNLSFASVLVMVSNSVSKTQMGAVNGIGQSGVALGRAIGPVLGGWVFARSMLWDHPLAVWTVFSFQALVLVFLFGYSFLLPTSLDKPFKEPEEIELEQVVTSQHLLSTSLDKEPEKSLNKS